MRNSTNTWRNAVAILVTFAFALLVAPEILQATAQTDCRWDGTAPSCDGECGAGESEITRLGFLPGGYPPYYYGPDFGKPCVTGTKALCCKTPGTTCRWDGTAPFCDGECAPGETKTQPPAGSSGGKACWSGSKVYCCSHTSTGSASSALKANPEWTRYAAFWEKGAGPAWRARHGLTSAQYQQEFNTLTKQGYRLVHISGYSVGGQDRYAAIWEKRQGPAWLASHGLTSAQYQQEFNTRTKQGYRLARISGWRSGATAHYAAIWVKIKGPAWVARHGMLSDAYQENFDKFAKQGYRLKNVSGYHTYD